MSKCAYCGGNNFHSVFCEMPHIEQQQIDALKIALADAIRSPMGVCPDSAQGLLTQEDMEAAERQR